MQVLSRPLRLPVPRRTAFTLLLPGLVALAAGASACRPLVPIPTATSPPSPTPPLAEAGATRTASPAPSPLPSATPVPSQAQTATAAPSPAPSSTPVPGPSPGPRPRGQPTLGWYESWVVLTATPPTAIPGPVARIPLEQEVVNILLMGSDKEDGNSFRTDTMIVLSINKETASVSMLSVPRDLYVFIPQWTMQRINTADSHGQTVSYPGGGPSLLIQTLLYNFGLPIHHYARVNFDGFKQVVDALGGIDVPVSCRLDDYILRAPGLDPARVDSWQEYSVPVGIQHMDGSEALLYARLRQSYRVYNHDLPVVGRAVDDFDRAHRQQQVLRAIYHRARGLDIVPQIPTLFARFSSIVETDMGLGDVLQFVPLLTRVGDLNIRSRYISRYYTNSWRTPDNDNVQLPEPERVRTLLVETLSGPPDNQRARAGQIVEVVNGTANKDWEVLAVDRLTSAGFNAVVGEPEDAVGTDGRTTLLDFTTSAKGSIRAALVEHLRLDDSQVTAQPDGSSPAHFRLVLGDDYDTCGR